MEAKKISVIIPTYNRKEKLFICNGKRMPASKQLFIMKKQGRSEKYRKKDRKWIVHKKIQFF